MLPRRLLTVAQIMLTSPAESTNHRTDIHIFIFSPFFFRITVFFGPQVAPGYNQISQKTCHEEENNLQIALDYKLHFLGEVSFTKSKTKSRHFIRFLFCVAVVRLGICSSTVYILIYKSHLSISRMTSQSLNKVQPIVRKILQVFLLFRKTFGLFKVSIADGEQFVQLSAIINKHFQAHFPFVPSTLCIRTPSKKKKKGCCDTCITAPFKKSVPTHFGTFAAFSWQS